jgi:hypothetical protein
MSDKREVSVTHHRLTEIDVDRLEEWITANYPDGGVQVIDTETGEALHDSL